MSKLLKITLLTFLIFLIIIIGVVTLLPLIIDPNDYKPEIEAAAYRYIGKKLILEGSLELAVFPWLGVSTGKVLVVDPTTVEQPALATIDQGYIKVKLLPLLRKKVELSRIVLKNPVIHLITDGQGNQNWDNKILTNASTVSDTSVRPEKITNSSKDLQKEKYQSVFPQELKIAGVIIENGRIIWLDEQNGRQTEVSQFNCEVGTLAHDQPASLNLSMALKRKQNQIEQLTAKGFLVFNKKLDHFKLTDLEINTLIEKPSVKNNISVAVRSANVELDWQKQDLKISELSVTSGDMDLSANLVGNKIKDNPELEGVVALSEFNPREFLTYLGKSVPATQDNSSLTQLSGSFNLVANKNSTQFNKFHAKLDDSNITGHIHISNFKQPVFKFNLMIDTINLDRYLLSKSAAKKNNKTSTQESSEVPEKSGTTSVAKISDKPQGKSASNISDKQNKSNTGLFPIDILRKINATGELSISNMTAKGMSLQDLIINLDAKNGVLKTTHKINKFYQGRYSGNLHLDVKKPTPVIALNEKFAKIQTKPMLKALYGKTRVTGTLNGKTHLLSHGNTIELLKASLDGRAQVTLKNGVINGFNLQEMVKKGKAALKKEKYTPKKQQTDFSIISANAIIKDGLVKNEDLTAKSERLRVTGKGTFNLVNEQLDYDAIAKVMKRKQTASEVDQVKRTLGINIAGPLKQPTYTLDLISLISEKEKQKLYDKAEKKLGKDVSNILRQLLK